MSGSRIRSGPPIAGRNGFSLLELLVVVALLALLATAAVPGLAGGRTGAAAAARAISELQGMARELAVTRGVESSLTLDLASGAWVLVVEEREGTLIERSGAVDVRGGVRLTSRTGPRMTATWDALGRGRAPLLAVSDAGHEYGLMVDLWTGVPEVVRVR